MKKVYLAIPYTGMEESSFKQANKATAVLLNKGIFNVFSPISHSHHISVEHGLPGDWKFWQEIDYQFIDWCEEVFVVIPEEGFDKISSSTGVMAEISYAMSKNKSVYFISINEENSLIFHHDDRVKSIIGTYNGEI